MARVEDAALLAGRGRFIDDLPTPTGTLHAAFVRAAHAHAVIKRIDVAAARNAPGVVAVLTGEDIAALTDSMVVSVKVDVECRPIARDRVRYAGEPVVVVVAEDRYLAEDAAVPLVLVMPAPLIAAVAGLAMINVLLLAFQNAFSKSLGHQIGAFAALIVAMSGVSLFGISAPFWALVFGVLISFATERTLMAPKEELVSSVKS